MRLGQIAKESALWLVAQIAVLISESVKAACLRAYVRVFVALLSGMGYPVTVFSDMTMSVTAKIQVSSSQ